MKSTRGDPVFLSSAKKQLFRRKLLAWYDGHKRDLPWRQDRDPYRVWLSEIMLQQTRVGAVREYYQRFLQRFPTVKKLAAARETSVLAAWSGLGYYRRARMLHAAARAIVKEHGAEFPGTARELRVLPGIGRYTAAAVASIAFDEPVAVVDGNVERVLVRVLGESATGEKAWGAAEQLLDRRRPGDFNQAMMELGSTLCQPRQPKCLLCPVSAVCATRGEGEKRSKKTRQHKREIHYALDYRDGAVFLVQRPPEAALMAGMWELPEISSAVSNSERRDCMTLRHSITATDYVVRVQRVHAPESMKGRWIEKRSLPKMPLTGLARKILRAAEF
jgi:A/G-specific adenine glycosylase